MSAGLRVLIVGGYGTFGGRLVQLLEDEPTLTLLIGGRSLAAATAYCKSHGATRARLIPALFDRATDDPAALAALAPDVVVDASGPFQAYGERPYLLIEHCLQLRIHYADLADGSEFVAGVGRFDSQARAAGVFVLAGVSSFPVLTAAVVSHLAGDLARVRSIRAGIAPSPYAGVGLNVVRAMASYAGQRIPVQRGGRSTSGRPFTESLRFAIAVPGRLPLAVRRFSLVDVPDHRVLARLWPEASDIWIGAAPVPATLHRLLTALAWLVRLGVLPSLATLARPIHWVSNHVRWGEHRGGMFVEVHGTRRDGTATVRQWHLLAEGADGPLIPSMAVAAIIRKTLAGGSPSPGARDALRDVDLADYESLFSRHAIFSGIREPSALVGKPLYERILGNAWNRLPAAIRHLHTVSSESSFEGLCEVRRGRNPISRLISACIGFPAAGVDRPIAVKLVSRADGEVWVRSVGGQRFSSVQTTAAGDLEWLVRERFGPVFVDIALLVEGDRLCYVVRRWGLGSLALPLAWGPRSTATEASEAGRFCFDVEIRHPLTGLIVAYRGHLLPTR
ncbi:MAG: DUF4166 domain-containing protein [Rhizobacter sp.]